MYAYLTSSAVSTCFVFASAAKTLKTTVLPAGKRLVMTSGAAARERVRR